jgi:hypothetical protein
MDVCSLNQSGEMLVHRTMTTSPETFLHVLAPERAGRGGAVECLFTWSWLADRCAGEGIPCVLGHALDMSALQGGKARHDTSDAQNLAVLLRGGRRPQASVYPAARRATRDLLRRRLPLRHTRAAPLAHRQPPQSRYHLPEIGKELA